MANTCKIFSADWLATHRNRRPVLMRVPSRKRVKGHCPNTEGMLNDPVGAEPQYRASNEHSAGYWETKKLLGDSDCDEEVEAEPSHPGFWYKLRAYSGCF